MLAQFGKYLLNKDQNAILIAFLMALLPVFGLPTGFVAVLIVGLVTLQKGSKAGFWILAWVALPTVALLVTRQVGLFDLLFLRCVVIWMLASLFRRRQSWVVLFDFVVSIGLAAIIALHLYNPNLQQWWVTELTNYLQKIAVESKVKEMSVISVELAKQIAPVATGIMAFFISLTVLMELAVARWWQTLISAPGKFMDEMVRYRCGKIALFLAMTFAVMALAKLSFAKDALPVVLLPMFFSGLSLLHFLARTHSRWIFLLIVVYAGFIFVPVLVVSALAVVAFVDTWVDFRKRLGVVS
jgi:hypothetical protein